MSEEYLEAGFKLQKSIIRGLATSKWPLGWKWQCWYLRHIYMTPAIIFQEMIWLLCNFTYCVMCNKGLETTVLFARNIVFWYPHLDQDENENSETFLHIYRTEPIIFQIYDLSTAYYERGVGLCWKELFSNHFAPGWQYNFLIPRCISTAHHKSPPKGDVAIT